MERVTQQDIADRLGISKMTVSRALRDDPAIKAETQARIKEMARTMGYVPNPLVSALMSNMRRSGGPMVGPRTIALIHGFGEPASWAAHPPSNTALIDYYRGGTRTALQLGFKADSFLVNPDEPASIERTLKILRARGVRALAFLPLGGQLNVNAEKLVSFALQDVGYSFPELALHRTAPNHFENIRRAVAEGLRRGCKRIGMIVPLEISRSIRDLWIAGYLTAHHDAPPGLSVPVLEIRCDDPSPLPELRSWARKHRPDWILHSGNQVFDEMTLLRLKSRPGFCDISMHSDSKAQCGIDQHHQEVGAQAIHSLVQRLNVAQFGVPTSPFVTQIHGIWVERGESG